MAAAQRESAFRREEVAFATDTVTIQFPSLLHANTSSGQIGTKL